MYTLENHKEITDTYLYGYISDSNEILRCNKRRRDMWTRMGTFLSSGGLDRFYASSEFFKESFATYSQIVCRFSLVFRRHDLFTRNLKFGCTARLSSNIHVLIDIGNVG